MTRIISYSIVYIFSIVLSIAQVKTEEILIQNDSIELPETLTFTSQEIKKITVPILIINGTKDLQVKVKDANNLHLSNLNSQLVIIENMNPILKHIEKDEENITSYYSADFSPSKKGIETIVNIVNQ